MNLINDFSSSCYSKITASAKVSDRRKGYLSPSHTRASTDKCIVDLFSKSSEHLGSVKTQGRLPKVKPPKTCPPELYEKVCRLVRENLDVEPAIGRERQGDLFIDTLVHRQVSALIKNCSKDELEELKKL